jgi:hypothetical protein
MRVFDHSFGIASRDLVVALSGISSPTRTELTSSLGTDRKRAGPCQDQIRRGNKHSIQEIPARNRLVQTEDFIEMRALTHREVPFSLTGFLRRRQKGKP